jgi:hypothetical protein
LLKIIKLTDHFRNKAANCFVPEEIEQAVPLWPLQEARCVTP